MIKFWDVIYLKDEMSEIYVIPESGIVQLKQPC